MFKQYIATALFLVVALNSFSNNNDESLTLVNDSSSINHGRLNAVIVSTSAIYIGYLAYLQNVWYKDHERVAFHYYNDSKGYKQIDKFGHVYGAYIQSYIGFHSLVWSGVPRNQAAIYGGMLGFFMQLPIEIWDGMYEGWGFSWSDVVANGLGSSLVIIQELAFKEQLIKYKFSFFPSPYAKQANGYLGTGFSQLLHDYNAHTYWISASLGSIVKGSNIPKWINISLGYSAGGMFGEFENKNIHKGIAIPETTRYRQFLLSMDVDFTQIPTRNKTMKKVLNSMFVIKVPFPAIEINTKGEFLFHPLYY